MTFGPEREHYGGAFSGHETIGYLDPHFAVREMAITTHE